MEYRGELVIEWFGEEDRGYGFVRLDCNCQSGLQVKRTCLPDHRDVWVHIDALHGVSARLLRTDFDVTTEAISKLPIPKRGTRVILNVLRDSKNRPQGYRWTYEELWDAVDREVKSYLKELDSRRAA